MYHVNTRSVVVRPKSNAGVSKLLKIARAAPRGQANPRLSPHMLQRLAPRSRSHGMSTKPTRATQKEAGRERRRLWHGAMSGDANARRGFRYRFRARAQGRVSIPA